MCFPIKLNKTRNSSSFALSDGLVRVFTYDADRVADAETLKAYEEELSATTLNAQQELGGIKLSE